jgi:hypothetical protein
MGGVRGCAGGGSAGAATARSNGYDKIVCSEFSDHVIEFIVSLCSRHFVIATLALLLILRHSERGVMRHFATKWMNTKL